MYIYMYTYTYMMLCDIWLCGGTVAWRWDLRGRSCTKHCVCRVSVRWWLVKGRPYCGCRHPRLIFHGTVAAKCIYNSFVCWWVLQLLVCNGTALSCLCPPVMYFGDIFIPVRYTTVASMKDLNFRAIVRWSWGLRGHWLELRETPEKIWKEI